MGSKRTLEIQDPKTGRIVEVDIPAGQQPTPALIKRITAEAFGARWNAGPAASAGKSQSFDLDNPPAAFRPADTPGQAEARRLLGSSVSPQALASARNLTPGQVRQRIGQTKRTAQPQRPPLSTTPGAAIRLSRALQSGRETAQRLGNSSTLLPAAVIEDRLLGRPDVAAGMIRRERGDALGAGTRAAGRSTAPTVAGVAGAGLGAAAVAPLAAMSGPAAPFVEAGGAVVGALGGASAMNSAQDALLNRLLSPTTRASLAAREQQDREKHKLATIVGEAVPSLITGRPNLSLARRALVNHAVGGTIGAANEGYSQYRTGKFDPAALGLSFGLNALLSGKNTALGDAAEDFGAQIGRRITRQADEFTAPLIDLAGSPSRGPMPAGASRSTFAQPNEAARTAPTSSSPATPAAPRLLDLGGSLADDVPAGDMGHIAASTLPISRGRVSGDVLEQARAQNANPLPMIEDGRPQRRRSSSAAAVPQGANDPAGAPAAAVPQGARRRALGEGQAYTGAAPVFTDVLDAAPDPNLNPLLARLSPDLRDYVKNAQPREDWIPTESIGFREDVFQFRKRTVADFPSWNAQEAAKNPVAVWQDRGGEIGPHGAIYVINGHHRIANARKFDVPAMRVRFVDAPDAATAREIGALENLLDSPRNDALDIANFVRNSRQAQASGNPGKFLRSYGVNTQSAAIREGLLLAGLPDSSFARLFAHSDNLPSLKPVAAAVVEHYPAGEIEARFNRAFERIEGGERVTPAQIGEEAAAARALQEQQQQTGAGLDFGDLEIRGRVIDRVKSHFRSLASAGSALSRTKAARFFQVTGDQTDRAEMVRQVIEVIDRTAHHTGPLGSLISETVGKIDRPGANEDAEIAALIDQLETGGIIADTLRQGQTQQQQPRAGSARPGDGIDGRSIGAPERVQPPATGQAAAGAADDGAAPAAPGVKAAEDDAPALDYKGDPIGPRDTQTIDMFGDLAGAYEGDGRGKIPAARIGADGRVVLTDAELSRKNPPLDGQGGPAGSRSSNNASSTDGRGPSPSSTRPDNGRQTNAEASGSAGKQNRPDGVPADGRRPDSSGAPDAPPEASSPAGKRAAQRIDPVTGEILTSAPKSVTDEARAYGARLLKRGIKGAAWSEKMGDAFGDLLDPGEIGALFGEAVRATESTAAVVARIHKAPLTSTQTVATLLGDRPEYLNGVIDFLTEQRAKLRDGQITARDVAKAYFMTLASQGADAISPDVLAKKTGLDVDAHYIEGGKVRPEEAAAAWLFTPDGQKALDAIERGEFDAAAWSKGAAVRRAYGDDRLGTLNAFGLVKKNRANMRNVADVAAAINAANGDPAKILAAVSKLNGIGAGKKGFVAHLLGMGSAPTIDAVEINLWITGQGDISGLKNSRASLARQIKAYSSRGPVTRALAERIEHRFRLLERAGLNPDNLPPDVFNHVLHHWLWDKAKGTTTTHLGMYSAQQAATVLPGGLPAGTGMGTLYKDAGKLLIDAANAPRSLMSSADFSAPLRQGAILTLTQPGQAIKASGAMLQAFASGKRYETIVTDLAARPNAPLYEDAGLYLATRDTARQLLGQTPAGNIQQREEAFISRLVGWLPHVKMSERAYVSYLDTLRADSFDTFARELYRRGMTPDANPDAFRDVARYVNAATGRGELPAFLEGDTATALSNVFFAPRYAASRVQVLNPAFYAKMAPGARAIAIRKSVQFLGVQALALTLAHLGGAEVNTDDPTSADWLKIKIGRTRYDTLAGLQQYMRLYSRIAAMAAKRGYAGEASPPGQSIEAVLGKFVRGKESPAFSFAHDFAAERTYTGERFNATEGVIKRVMPLMANDLLDAYRKEGKDGLTRASITNAPGVLGIGVNTYEDRPNKPRRKGKSSSSSSAQTFDGFAGFSTGRSSKSSSSSSSPGAASFSGF